MLNKKFTPQDFSPVPTNEYVVTCRGIYEAESKFGNDSVKLDLEISEGQYQGRKLSLWLNVQPQPTMKSKIVKTFRAFGIDVIGGQEVSVQEIIGNQAVATVVIREDNDDGRFNRVESLRALPNISY